MQGTEKFKNWLLKPVTSRPTLLDTTHRSTELSSELLTEDHHRIYGRPWLVGRYYMELLYLLGLKSDDEIIEIGCGAGRLGARLINYLDSGKYFGIDNDIVGLQAFNSYEVFYWGCEKKSYKLLHDSNFSLELFGVKPKWFLDFWVSAHLRENDKELLAKKVYNNSKVGSKYVVTPANKIEKYLIKNSFEKVRSDAIDMHALSIIGESKKRLEYSIYERV